MSLLAEEIWQYNLMQQAVRFGWQVVNRVEGSGKSDLDVHINTRLFSESGLSPYFRTPCTDKETAFLRMQSIAPAILLAQDQSKHKWAKSPFRSMTPKDRKELLDSLCLDTERHINSLYFVKNPKELAQCASDLAAAYAFTTELVPLIMPAKQVGAACFASVLKDTPDYHMLQSEGFLIITGVMDSLPGILKAADSIAGICFDRLVTGRATVLLQVATGSVLESLRDPFGSPMSCDVISQAVKDSPVGETGLIHYLANECTYYGFINPLPQINPFSVHKKQTLEEFQESKRTAKGVSFRKDGGKS